jgi:hypothetical protein
MADEEKEVVDQQAPVKQEVQFTDIEKRASAEGWVPKDEWDGDPEQWRPAKEFVDRGELFKKIEDQNRTIKDIRKALEDFGKHHAQVRDVEFKRALETLKAQKKDAIELGEADKIIDIDEKMDAVKDAQRQAASRPVVNIPDVPQENPVFLAWVNRNNWYRNNAAMRAYADRLGNEIGSRENLSPTDLLSRVEAEIKKEFAHKFENPNRNKASGVEGSTNKGTTRKNDDIELSDDERKIAERFVRTIPGFTMEQYKKDLKAKRGV